MTTVTQSTATPTRKQSFNLLGSQLTTMLLVILAGSYPKISRRYPHEVYPGLG